MVVWGKGDIITDLALRAQKTKAPATAPGSMFAVDQVQMPGQKSIQEQRASNLATGYDRADAALSMVSPNADDGNDFLSKAENLMFQANQVQAKASQARLKGLMGQYQNAIDTSQGPKVQAQRMGLVSEPKGSKYGLDPTTFDGKGNKIQSSLDGGGNKLQSFLKAISGKESGGNYSARNSDSGAMGKYQIMPANIAGPGGWDREALGKDITTGQFMNTPKLQESIARYKLTQYFQKYGAAGAASAWYSGSPTKWKSSTGAQGSYPSIHNYVTDILHAMGM